MPASPGISTFGNSARDAESTRLSEREMAVAQQQLRHADQGLANGNKDRPARGGQSASRTGPTKSSGVSRRKKSEPGVMRREIDSW